MKTYHGERTGDSRTATADGTPLRLRSGLWGNATAPSDRGYGGSGQVSPAPRSDFLGDDQWAEQFYEAVERQAVAELAHDSWTLAPVTQLI